MNRYISPTSNQPTVDAVQLPTLYLICPPPGIDHPSYLKNFEACIIAGISLFQLRFKESLQYQIHAKLIATLLQMCHENNCRLLINSSAEYALKIGVDGAHMTSSRLMQYTNPRPRQDLLISASCHNAVNIEYASKMQLDFAVLSPVNKTTSHQDTTPLGWDKFHNIVKHASIPIYALGGMQPEDIQIARMFGGHGIAVLGGFWNTNQMQKKQFLYSYAHNI